MNRLLDPPQLRLTRRGCSFEAPGLRVGLDAFLDEGFVTNGVVRLDDAAIGGRLMMGGAKLDVANNSGFGYSLHAPGLHVGSDAHLDGEFVTNGAVGLDGAAIGGRLTTGGGAKLKGHSRDGSLSAKGLHVGSDATLDGDFEPSGGVTLAGARIDGTLTIRATHLRTLDLSNCSVHRFDGWHDVTLVDTVRTQGFAFSTLGQSDWRAHRRTWLARQLHGPPTWSPDPYEQLAAYYTRTGNERSARKVRIARNWDELWHMRELWGLRSLPYQLWRGALGLLVGFGYRRWPAGALLAASIVLAGVVYLAAENSGAMVPNQPTTEDSEPEQPATTGSEPDPSCGEAYPCFNSWVYGADVVLPIIDFGQDSAWRPIDTGGEGHWWVWSRWMFITVGWMLASVFVAAFTSLVQRT